MVTTKFGTCIQQCFLRRLDSLTCHLAVGHSTHEGETRLTQLWIYPDWNRYT